MSETEIHQRLKELRIEQRQTKCHQKKLIIRGDIMYLNLQLRQVGKPVYAS